MRTIYDAFKQQVTVSPNALAIMDDKHALTYKELDSMATEIANSFPITHQAIALT